MKHIFGARKGKANTAPWLSSFIKKVLQFMTQAFVPIRMLILNNLPFLAKDFLFCFVSFISQKIYNLVFTIIYVSPAPYCEQQLVRFWVLVYNNSDKFMDSGVEKIDIC